jgi:hypothetical protein
MAEFEIKDPTEKYTDTVNEVLDLVDNLNDYEGEVTRVRVAVELDTTNGKQLHFLEKQFDSETGKFNTSTGFYEQHHPDIFKAFEKTFHEYHDSKVFPHTHKTF